MIKNAFLFGVLAVAAITVILSFLAAHLGDD